MVERGLLPICRRLTFIGAAVFEQTALFDAIITPTESTTLIYRVERIDGDSRPRERKSGSHRAFAELPQQFGFGHSTKPTLDQPCRGPRNLAVVHPSYSARPWADRRSPYGEVGAASTAARGCSQGRAAPGSPACRRAPPLEQRRAGRSGAGMLPARYRLNGCNHDPRVRWPRPRRRRAVAAGIAAVKASDPRAASSACRRTRKASCSERLGEPRAAKNPRTAAMTRLAPSRMTVAAIDATYRRSTCQPVISAQTSTPSANTSGNRAQGGTAPLTFGRGAKPQHLGFCGNSEQANDSHDGTPSVQRQSRPAARAEY